MRTVRTSDGYRWFESDMGWVDSLRKDGTPYRIDMVMSDETINQMIEDGDADVFEWSDEWTPFYAGPFDSEDAAVDYVVKEYAPEHYMMPCRIRSIINKADGKTIWVIDCKREASKEKQEITLPQLDSLEDGPIEGYDY